MVDRETFITINGQRYSAEFGTIESTHLGIEDHGILTSWLSFTFGGSGQGAGGYDLGRPSKPSIGLAQWVDAILRVFKVDSWEQVKGKQAFVLREYHSGPIAGLAHPSEDRYVIFREIFD